MDLWAVVVEVIMITIVTKGIRKGKPFEVKCTGDGNDFEILFNGLHNEAEAEWLSFLAQRSGSAAGGTYYPATYPLRLLSVLRARYFDRAPVTTVDVTGDSVLEEIPGEDGVIY